jgi:hypothetical protein
MQMIGGYPDGNDSNLLRRDPVLQMLVGKATSGTAAATPREPADDEPLGHNGFCLRQLVRAFDAMVDNFIASYAGKAPGGLVLDLDPPA